MNPIALAELLCSAQNLHGQRNRHLTAASIRPGCHLHHFPWGGKLCTTPARNNESGTFSQSARQRSSIFRFFHVVEHRTFIGIVCWMVACWLSFLQRMRHTGLQVEMGKEVGRGSFGTTYRGKWRGHDCAVKVPP